MSVVGARPNFMKLASIARAIEDHNISHKNRILEHLIVHTGQHYDDRMSQLFFEELELPKPHINLNVGSASHAVQTAEVMRQFEPILLEQQPDVVVLVGDVNSTIACALVASKIEYRTPNSALRTPNSRRKPWIAHVEAGLRSFDRTMPEEINRVLTDALSDFLFITEQDAMVNLAREGIPQEKTFFVGNVMIDTLLFNLKKIEGRKGLPIQNEFNHHMQNGFVLVTLHRPSNVDIPEKLIPLMECLKKIALKIPVIFPAHPRTRLNLERFGILKTFSKSNGILLTEPLGYLEFLRLLKSTALVLTDSGGIQEETTFLRIPCITLRENTERPVTIRLGTNYLAGTNPEKILETAFTILDGRGKKGEVPPLWDGKAGKRIVEILVNKLVTPNPDIEKGTLL